ncbi:MAG: hypothetical protein DSZ28_09995 [Thiothrix sp.]|nr:MAG: hypothetical protein DSZ28_09995 [Thiothrix sp.]
MSKQYKHANFYKYQELSKHKTDCKYQNSYHLFSIEDRNDFRTDVSDLPSRQNWKLGNKIVVKGLFIDVQREGTYESEDSVIPGSSVLVIFAGASFWDFFLF